MKINSSLAVVLALFVISCTQSSPTVPKPRAYPRIDRRVDSVVVHDVGSFFFQYPSDANLVIQGESDASSIWFNLQYPDYNATLYCTYVQITANSLTEAMQDNNRFLQKESTINSYIKIYEESYSNSEALTCGRLYYLEGKAVNPFQFYLTDSTRYFLRGTLYYNTTVNTDSVASITQSLRADIVKLMETFRINPIK